MNIREAKNCIDTYNSRNKECYKPICSTISKLKIYLDISRYTIDDMIGKYAVYITRLNGRYYIGKTNNIARRICEHFTRCDGILFNNIGSENCIYIGICEIFANEKDALEYETKLINSLKYIKPKQLINKR